MHEEPDVWAEEESVHGDHFSLKLTLSPEYEEPGWQCV